MREIKFRAWDTYNERMVDEPEKFIPAGPHHYTDEPRFNAPFQYYETWQDIEDGVHRPCHIMQYTGLKDKNGKEIYEGDIVQLYRHDDYKKYTYKHEKAEVWADGKYQPDIKEVKFMYGSFVIWSDLIRDYRCFANLARPGESLEVIGNRFEHPELLSPTPSQEAKD